MLSPSTSTRPTTIKGMKMSFQHEIDEYNREIHNLTIRAESLQFAMSVLIAEVRKLEEMQRIAARAGISA